VPLREDRDPRTPLSPRENWWLRVIACETVPRGTPSRRAMLARGLLPKPGSHAHSTVLANGASPSSRTMVNRLRLIGLLPPARSPRGSLRLRGTAPASGSRQTCLSPVVKVPPPQQGWAFFSGSRAVSTAATFI